MKIQHLSGDEAMQSLRSGPEGLSSDEARRRLLEFGPNRVEKARGEPLAWHFGKEFTHVFALMLWAAAALAFWADRQDPGQGMATLGWAIIGVIVINSLFSFAQVYRAERALAALERLLPHRVKVFRDGVFTPQAVAALVPVLLGLDSLVVLAAARCHEAGLLSAEETAWYAQEEPTFSDCLRLIRSGIWQARMSPGSHERSDPIPLPREFLDTLIHGLASAA